MSTLCPNCKYPLEMPTGCGGIVCTCNLLPLMIERHREVLRQILTEELMRRGLIVADESANQ